MLRSRRSTTPKKKSGGTKTSARERPATNTPSSDVLNPDPDGTRSPKSDGSGGDLAKALASDRRLASNSLSRSPTPERSQLHAASAGADMAWGASISHGGGGGGGVGGGNSGDSGDSGDNGVGGDNDVANKRQGSGGRVGEVGGAGRGSDGGDETEEDAEWIQRHIDQDRTQADMTTNGQSEARLGHDGE